jgi:hypothetical protein
MFLYRAGARNQIKKLYTPHQARYHYAWIIETDSYEAVMAAMTKMPPRNRNELTHSVVEVFTEM